MSDVRFTLWPRSTASGVDENFTDRLVYRNFGPGGLIRPIATTVWIVPSRDIVTDSTALRSHIDAAEALTRVTNGRLTFAVDPDATTGVIIRTRIDPDHPMAVTGAGAIREFEGRTIVGGAIIFGGVGSARCMGVVLHELGHEFGLGHSPDSRDLMGPGPCPRRDFSEREKVVMNLMLQRPPGNQFPDNDRGAIASHARNDSGVLCAFTDTR